MPDSQSGHLPWFAPPRFENSPALTKRPPDNVLIVGAGLAGCTTAYELSRRGWKVTLLEQAPRPAAAASGNRAAVLRPHITREPSLASSFFTEGWQAMLELLHGIDTDRKTLAAASLPTSERDALYGLPGALQLLNNAGEYPDSDHYEKLDHGTASRRAGISLHSDTLFFADAGWVDIALFCQALLDQSSARFLAGRRVLSILKSENSDPRKPFASSWKVRSCRHSSSDSTEDVHTDTYSSVVLASGVAISELAGTKALTLIPARGQTTVLSAPQGTLATILCGKQTVIPVNGGESWQVGSTYQRNCLDSAVSDADDKENLAMLEQMLGKAVSRHTSCQTTKLVSSSWAAVRATTPDRLPVLGPLPDFTFYEKEYRDLRHGRSVERYETACYQNGLYVNGGYGSRGLSVAASCAKLLADAMERGASRGSATQTSEPSLMTRDSQFMELLHPARFLIRQLRRDRTIQPD